LDNKELVRIIVNRKNGKIQYKVECSKEVTGVELAHYLDEIIEGICSWKPEVCQETMKTIIGAIEQKTPTKE
jgi:hypothetical protein